MPLARLDNFLKNLNGNTLYVDPNELDSTDSIENKGNSRTRPFKTIQRALIEATRFSYVAGSNNDLFDQTTILIAPGTHYIDNRPGYYWNGSEFKNVSNNTVTISEFSVATNFDLESSANELYIYNSAEGGVIIPKGVSLVATDLRKTKIRPRFVPDPANNSISRSAIFRVTGGSYIFGFTIFDGDPTGGVYNTYTTSTVNPTYSHHKLTAFEYADGKNVLQNSTLTDLANYYYKISKGFGPFSGRTIDPDNFVNLAPNPEENKIVGDLGQGTINISDLISGDGVTASTTITVTTEEPHGLTAFTPIQISNVAQNNSEAVQQKLNGNFVVAQVISPTQFTYLVQAPAPAVADPSVNGGFLKIQSDTVSSSSPYIFNCSLKSTYGMNGLHADGSKATGFKSIVTAQFTGISLQRDDRAFVKYDEDSGTYLSQNNFGTSTVLHQDSKSIYNPSWESYHIKASNDAFIQAVSVFAIGYSKHFVAESGGDQSITNSNSNFGSISLFSSGFKKDQLAKDNNAFITHIIPPKDIKDVESNINCYRINVELTTTVANNTRVYLKGYTDPFTPPSVKVRGYTIGARSGDTIYYPGSAESAVISPNYEASYNVDSIATNVITVEGSLSGISVGQAVRMIAKNSILPDGIEHHKVYYVSPNSLTSTTLKLRDSLSNIDSTNVIYDLDIKNDIGITPEDNLKLVFRVSDCLPGNPGNPFKFDSTQGNWYLTISADTNFINSLSGQLDPVFYIKRKIDLRTSDDKVYRARIVIPKESLNSSEPTSGFIIQKSSSDLNSVYSQPSTISLSSGGSNPIETIRNKGIIVDAWTTTSGLTTTANIITSRPHGLSVGNKININNLKSSNETSPVGLGSGFGFNGEFEVSAVVDNLHFRYVINRNPGSISTTTSSSTPTWLNVRNCSSSTYRIPPYTINSANRSDLPYFTCEEVENDFQIFKIKPIQKYVSGESDGIYHAYLNVFKNTPSVSPFNIDSYKLSQNLDNIYPQLDVDNVTSDVEAATSAASRQTIGKVEVNDERLSTTKETIIQYLKDFDCGLKVSSISKSGSTCTLTTTLNHNLNGIRQLSVTSGGSGFANGTYYDIPLCPSTGTGEGATANITVSGGTITSATISYPGSGYSVNSTVVPKGIPGSTSAASFTIISVTPENLGAVQILGSLYPENNGTFKVTSVTSNTIVYENASGRIESSSSAVIIPNIPAYSISSVGTYNSTLDTSQVTTTFANSFLIGNKVLFEGSNTEFTIVDVSSNTTFTVSGDVPGTPATVYSTGLNPQPKDTDLINENLSSRHFSIVDGYKGRILNALTTTTSSFTARLANSNTNSSLALDKGDFIQVDDEILLIDSISGSTVSCIRGVLGTKSASHAGNSAFRRIIVTPIELRKNSILRASGHTFEYTGFGPGNYSTGMPTNQDRVLTNDEILISQSLASDGGLVVYTGMNSNGEFFIGRKKYDALTGEELNISNIPQSEDSFSDNLTVNNLTVNSSLDASTAISQFGETTITGNLSATGVTTFSSVTISNLTQNRVVLVGTQGQLVDDSSLTYTDASGLVVANSGINVTGVSTFSTNVIVGGDIRINGNDIRSSTNNIAITLNDQDVSIPEGNLVVSGTVTANSDESIKKNIKTIEDALNKVLSLRGVEYDRVEIEDHQIGVIAQEVEKIIPEVVYPKGQTSDEEIKSVAYGNLIGLLIEAIKEQNKKIEEIEKKIK